MGNPIINLMPHFATVEDQFWFALGVSSLAFTLGAILREFFRDREIRIVGRCLVIASFFAFSCYSYHATMTCQRVLAAVSPASEVSDEQVLYASKQTSITTKGGNKIDWVTYTDKSRSVPSVSGRTGRVIDAARRLTAADSGSDCCTGEVQGRKPAADF